MTATIQTECNEVEYHGESLMIIADVTYRVTAGERRVHTFRNGDPGYPGSPAEVTRVAFMPVRVIGEHEEWPKLRIAAERTALIAALDRWYSESPDGIDDEILEKSES